MRKSILDKTFSSILVVTLLIGGLFVAKFAVWLIAGPLPLTLDQIEMLEYLFYIAWLFVISYHHAP